MPVATLKIAMIALLGWRLLLPAAPAQSSRVPGREDGSFDVLFLAADAPLWLRLRLDGERQGVHLVRLRYARLLIDSVDADEDGFAGPSEAEQLPADGRANTQETPLGDRWREFDSIEPDGKLSPAEYLVAIDASIGPIFTTRRKPPVLAQSVQLLQRLDRNRDQRVSSTEIEEGPQTLGAFDFDDDGTFSPAELQPFPQTMVDAAMSEQLGDEAQPFVLVDESTNRDNLVDRLMRKYASDEGMPLERTGVSEFAFLQLDSDRDGWLNRNEAAGLLRPRPAVEIGIDLFAGRVQLRRKGRAADQVSVLPASSERRLSLRLGSEMVEFSAHDNRFAASDQINLLRVRCLQRDTDKNGYMEPQEFATLAGLDAGFDEVDRDGDGKVFLDELDRFIRLESYLAQCSIEMEVEAVEKPLFKLIDDNLDRRLTAREFASATSRLGEFDHDADGVLDAKELDLLRRFRIRFAFVVPPAVRPERDTSMMANRRLPVTNRIPQSGPEWYQDMDRNQDGDLTWREFLGPRELFDQLDADQSGWIDAQEAAASPER